MFDTIASTGKKQLFKAIFMVILFGISSLQIKAQTEIWSENFDSYSETYPLDGSSYAWVITGTSGNNDWAFYEPSHSSITSQCLEMYYSSADLAYDNSTAADEIVYYATEIDATGYESLTMDFDWMSGGDENDCFKVVYSLDGSNWNDVSSAKYYGQTSNWQTVSALDLSSCDDDTFYIGFNWINDASGGDGTGPCFDEISISGSVIACSGTPAPGNTQSTATEVCPSENFTLSLQNDYSGYSGISYQWQSSSDGSTWSDMSGETSSTCTTSITEDTYYRCNVTCSGEGTGESSSLQIEITMGISCYCDITARDNDYCDGITHVEFEDISNSSDGQPGYTDFTSNSTTLMQNETYQLTVQVNTAGDYSYNQLAWIDWDKDGEFEASEKYDLGSATDVTDGASSNSPLDIDVPGSAVTGTTYIRIVSYYDNGWTPDPCHVETDYDFQGEAEDYTINIIEATACSATPDPGDTQSTDTEVCSGTEFTLSLENAFSYSGISYQWQSSSDGSNWSDMSGETSSTCATSVTDDTYFRCKVTCDGYGTGTSDSLLINVISSISCYCSAEMTGTEGGISNVSFNTIDNDSDYDQGYSNYTTIATNVLRDSTYTANVTIGDGDSYRVNVFIDWNQDGDFEDTGEETQLGITSDGTVSSDITVPSGAAYGFTFMRVIAHSSGYSGPCEGTGYYGEVEDYKIRVKQLTACDADPVPGATTGSENPVCVGNDFTLSLENDYYYNTGISYQWQSSSDGSTWSNISGATHHEHTTNITEDAYYHCIVSCDAAESDTSTSLLVETELNASCYCESYGSTSGYGTKYVGIEQIDNATSSGYTYVDYTDQMATVELGESYDLSVRVNTYGSATADTYAFIDWNQDGDFADAGESYDLGDATDVSDSPTDLSPLSVTIPGGAETGITIMRVITSIDENPTDPCATSFNGETEDYSIRVVDPVTCSGTPTGGTVTPDYQCTSSDGTVTLTVQDYDYNDGITFQWQETTDTTGTWSDVTDGAGATTPVYTTGPITETTYFRLKTTCGSKGPSHAFSDFGKVDIAYLIGTASSPVTSCSGAFFDSGGNNNDYENNENYGTGYYLTIEPSVSNSSIKVFFDAFYTEEECDFLYVYNGNSTDAEDMTGSYSGELYPFEVFSTDPSGKLTFVFDSDGASHEYGWEARWECVPPCSGTPDGGVASISMEQGCTGISTTLYVFCEDYDQNGDIAAGYSYQWQESSDGSNWSDISGETNPDVTEYSGATTDVYFRLEVTCNESSEVGYSNEVLYDAVSCDTYNIDDASSVSTCAASFYDTGGASSNYSNSENETITFCSDGSNGEHVKVVFFNIAIDVTDTLYVYDGNSTSSTLIFKFNGESTVTNIAPEVISYGSCLTFEFISNASEDSVGWEAIVMCADEENQVAHNFCNGATHICNLNGYTGTTSGFYQPSFPGDFEQGSDLFGGTIENNSWLTFTAAETTAEFDITVNNCSGGSNAIQLGVYSGIDCDNFSLLSSDYYTSSSATLCNNTTTTITVPDRYSSALDLVPGDHYYLMVDGNAGSICDYAIEGKSGVEYASVSSTNACQKEFVTASGGDSYAWSGQDDFSSTDSIVQVMSVGTYTVIISGGIPECPDDVIYNVNVENCDPLPVELIDFSARCSEDNAIISWTTQSEINNDYFILEKSKNLLNFNQIAEIQGNGNSNLIRYYSFCDTVLYSGNNYYRVKQVDYDGTENHSPIIQVDCIQEIYDDVNLGVYPNPFDNKIFIKASKSVDCRVEIRNVYGGGVYNNTIVINGHSEINTSELSPGFYVLVITMPDEQQHTFKLIRK